MFRNAFAIVAAASMAAAPALAQSAPAPASVERAGPAVDGNRLNGGSYFAPALAALIILLGILTATGVLFDDDDDRPVSP